MSRVLVTGAAGFIGSHLVEALLQRGDEVVGLDNFDPFYPRDVKEANIARAVESPLFSFIEADLTEPGGWAAELNPETVVVHLAAKAGVRPSMADPVGYTRANVDATVALLAAARESGVRRFVLGSSSSVYGDDTPVPFREDATAVRPVSPYAATKRAAELLLESVAGHWGLQAVSLRFFTVYGPRQRPDLAIHKFTRLLTEGAPLTLYGDGTQSRDYTYVSDIINGVIAAVDWTETAPPGVEIVNLGNAQPVALRDLVATISGALGVEPECHWEPVPPGDVQHTFADVTKAERLLGYRPATDLSQGIKIFVDWYRGRHEHKP